MIRQGLRLLLQAHSDVEVIAELANGRDLLDFLGVAPRAATPRKAALPDDPHPPGRVVVLLDLVMPDLDGLDVLAALRHHPRSQRPRTLVLTTYDDETRIRGALALGADGFILKDSTPHQLITAIRSLAGGLTALSPAARDVAVIADAGKTTFSPSPTLEGVERQAMRQLTPRETEVLTLLGEGLTNRAIAHQLGVSERTVKIHVSNVLSKLEVESRTQAALFAQREMTRSPQQ